MIVDVMYTGRSLKQAFHIHNVQKFNSHLKDNTLHLHNKYKTVSDIVQRSNQCLL
jgi:ATP phosphoribosyltransferase